MAIYRIAVGTVDGLNITEHFGRAKAFRIVEVNQDSDQEMLEAKIQALLDWNVTAVLIARVGPGSERMLTKNGIQVLVNEGSIKDAMVKIKQFYKRHTFDH